MGYMNTLTLNKGAERRVRGGHLWIYSNEIDNKSSPLKKFSAGEQVVVQDAAGRGLGVAMMNPQHLICARMISRDPLQPLNRTLLIQRIREALHWRERIYGKPFYRMVYGDSDFLPGLVVDRYGGVLSVQCNSAGMAVLQHDVLAALEEVCAPCGIAFKNDSLARDSEGLDVHVDIHGNVPDWLELEENGVTLTAPLKIVLFCNGWQKIPVCWMCFATQGGGVYRRWQQALVVSQQSIVQGWHWMRCIAIRHLFAHLLLCHVCRGKRMT